MTTTHDDKARERFEAWVRKDAGSVEYGELLLQRDYNGRYSTTRIQGAWEGWQARAALSPASGQEANAIRKMIGMSRHALDVVEHGKQTPIQ